MNSTLSYSENFTGNEYEWTMKHNEIHMKHKGKHIYYTHNHMNLMKQSCCLSLILCQNIQWRTEFLSHSIPEITINQPFANGLHTINRLCHKEIERPGVGEFLKSLQNGDGKATISYRCSVTKMTNGLGDRFPSFATWIEAKLFKFSLVAKKSEV